MTFATSHSGQLSLLPCVGWEMSTGPGIVAVLLGWKGLALHWPCIADSVLHPAVGSVAPEREMSATPMLL